MSAEFIGDVLIGFDVISPLSVHRSRYRYSPGGSSSSIDQSFSTVSGFLE